MEFRDDAREKIQAPGPEAVRSTVNRRRRIGTAVAACGLAAVLAVGAWAVLRPTTAPEPVASDTAPAITYDRSLAAAFSRAQFGNFDPDWATIPNAPIWWGPTGTEAVERTFRYPGSPPGARVTLTAACVGTGSLTLSWRVGSRSADITLSCEEDGFQGHTQINPLTPEASIDAVEVTLQGDERVTSEGAFVVIMSDPRSLAAQAMLGPPSSPGSVTSTGTTYNPFGTGGTMSQRVGPGRYRMTLVCVGDPRPEVEPEIRVQLSIAAGDLVWQNAACPPEGGHIDLEVSTSSEANLDLSIRYTGSMGYAYHIVRTELTD